MRPQTGWFVQFWDFGHWDNCHGPHDYKSQAIEVAQRLNRETDHITRQEVFQGHRYRVRFSK